MLRRLSHRGATGADPKTGDGAGILIQIPHDFFVKACRKIRLNLPNFGEYGTGLVFLPQDKDERAFCKDIFARIIKNEGQVLLGWRAVPVDPLDIGRTACQTQPVIEQVFIGAENDIVFRLRPGIISNPVESLGFERKLYVIRKIIENTIRASELKEKGFFYITNLSSRTFSYKGLLMPGQVDKFFTDLKDEDIKSSLCLVHSRYSTNTFPTWDLSQPFRFIAHNGEINTLRGNINWMRARQGLLESKIFGKDLKKIFPVIVPGGSDSATLDNVFELLVLSGRPLAHAMMMLIPSAWEQDALLDEKIKSFYKYHTCFMEPWDGPAAIAFTDGARIGAVLDRNGLRPARYIVTKQDLVVMASEVGVLDIAPNDILISGRLEPGKMFFIDTEKGAIIEDEQLKKEISGRQPYGAWLKESSLELDKISFPRPKTQYRRPKTDILTQLKAFGYTREDLKTIIKPMAENAQEPVGSMGNDTPHAVLSNNPQPLFAYFKQLFAQVTNPAIDPIREELVMSLETYLGPEKNILEESPKHCHKLLVRHPILTNEELEKIRQIKENSFKTKTISLLFKVSAKKGLEKALDRICRESAKAIKEGYTFIILSDRGLNLNYAGIPSLLAVSSVHHYLVAKLIRTQVGLILESAEPREVHHFALLFGFGADCINPYLAFEAVAGLVKEGELNLDLKTSLQHYLKAVDKGILKILSKMGISTLQSYRGAQIFEAVGLDEKVINKYFPGTVSRIGGANLEVISQEVIIRHQRAFAENKLGFQNLASGGLYQWKKRRRIPFMESGEHCCSSGCYAQ